MASCVLHSVSMSNIELLEKADVDESVAKVYRDLETAYDFTPDLFKALAHSPSTMKATVELLRSFSDFVLSERLRELAYFKASLCNGCNYCVAHHQAALKKAGLGVELLEALKDGRYDGFEEPERAVLLFAKQLTESNRVEPHTMKLLKRNFSPRERVELAVVVGVANMTNRINHALEIEPEKSLAGR